MYYIMKFLLIIYWFFGTQDLISILWDVAFVICDIVVRLINRISFYVKEIPECKDDVCPEIEPILDMGLLFKSPTTFEDDKLKMKLLCLASTLILVYMILY